jgi:hypothetical protein
MTYCRDLVASVLGNGQWDIPTSFLPKTIEAFEVDQFPSHKEAATSIVLKTDIDSVLLPTDQGIRWGSL